MKRPLHCCSHVLFAIGPLRAVLGPLGAVPERLLAGDRLPIADLQVLSDAESIPDDSPRAAVLDLRCVDALLKAAKGRKATGPDGLGPAVWKAGGEPAALLARAVLNATRQIGRCPLALKGGRKQDMWKRRGARH
eukprot:287514-Pyramimonas_sp.AAC.1